MITTSLIYKNTKRLNDNGTLLDVAMECADFLEQTGAFAYKNWEDGEFVSGPYIENYYVTFTLMYPFIKTPDPDFIARIANLDCIVEMHKDEYHRVYYARNEEVKFGDQMFKKNISKHKVWLITIKVPQRFLALDGNTVFNIDGKDVYYDDIDALYDGDIEQVDSGNEGGGADFGDMVGGDDGDFDL